MSENPLTALWCEEHNYQAGPRGFCWAAVSRTDVEPDSCRVQQVVLVRVEEAEEVEVYGPIADSALIERLLYKRVLIVPIGEVEDDEGEA